jgi:hypothetical protein
MSNFITFSTNTTAVPVEAGGILNGYKLNSILHSGRKISLAQNAYYYIPYTNTIVSFRGSKAKAMVRSDDGKYSFIEKFTDRKGHWTFKVDSAMVHEAALTMFR